MYTDKLKVVINNKNNNNTNLGFCIIYIIELRYSRS